MELPRCLLREETLLWRLLVISTTLELRVGVHLVVGTEVTPVDKVPWVVLVVCLAAGAMAHPLPTEVPVLLVA